MLLVSLFASLSFFNQYHLFLPWKVNLFDGTLTDCHVLFLTLFFRMPVSLHISVFFRENIQGGITVFVSDFFLWCCFTGFTLSLITCPRHKMPGIDVHSLIKHTGATIAGRSKNDLISHMYCSAILHFKNRKSIKQDLNINCGCCSFCTMWLVIVLSTRFELATACSQIKVPFENICSWVLLPDIKLVRYMGL